MLITAQMLLFVISATISAAVSGDLKIDRHACEGTKKVAEADADCASRLSEAGSYTHVVDAEDAF